MEYTVVKKDTAEELTVAVNQLIKEGWQISGSLTQGSNPPSFSQAMTKGNNMPNIIKG